MENLKEKVYTIGDDISPVLLYGPNESFINLIARSTGCRVMPRGSQIKIIGPENDVEQAYMVCDEMAGLLRRKKRLTENDVYTLMQVHRHNVQVNINTPVGGDAMSEEVITTAKKAIRPKSEGQRQIVSAVAGHDLVFVVGPAGTGKTYVAVALAVHFYNSGRIKKIILTRPAVEAGESLGYLPGDFKEKIDPYLKPLYDALEDMIPKSQLKSMFEDESIEIVPLAYMRGRTLNNAFVILDEAQNTTFTQMKMFLTRLGANTKAMITGDVTQVDLEHGKESGLISGIKVLKSIEQIRVVRLDREDVVRHPLVKKIIDAYDSYDTAEDK